jgi:hypothetical protein
VTEVPVANCERLAGRTSLALTAGSVLLTGPPGFFHFICTMR